MADNTSFVEKDLIKIAERLWPGEPLVIVGTCAPYGKTKMKTAALHPATEKLAAGGKR